MFEMTWQVATQVHNIQCNIQCIYTFNDNQAVPKHAVSAVLGTRFSAAPHAAAVSAESRFLAVFSWVFLVLAEKLHIPGFEPETKRMQHLNTTNQTKLSHQQNDFLLKLKILQIVMNSNKVET
ncbi:Hypothetical_protein [Hexamita inflata]|uniref:Hypothetical_protein n=1 Tax=Hexamita inflata TaxID=28002 RepID=A0AA86U5T7_9EUKA|nr:Hypothetical protein HINF_LOCUS9089 [Hexamita inflata]CAI9940481.1 Hypothetical protein HINF_LOCUS28126 [Hexamita inflata]